MTHVPKLIDAGHVERLHTRPHHLPYSIAQHSWGMAVLLYHLWPGKNPPSHQLVMSCLEHDLPEYQVGDVPRHTKERWPDLTSMLEKAERVTAAEMGVHIHSLSDAERDWLRGLDLLELYLFCLREEKFGNDLLLEVKAKCDELLNSSWVPEPVRQVHLNTKQEALL